MPSGYNQYQWSRSVNFESAIFSTQQKVTLSNGTYTHVRLTAVEM
jgi:hypothetical protein